MRLLPYPSPMPTEGYVLLFILGVTAFLISFFVKQRGFAKSLLLLPSFALVGAGANYFDWLMGSPSDFTGLLGSLIVFQIWLIWAAPPIVVGALVGWLLRRLRG